MVTLVKVLTDEQIEAVKAFREGSLHTRGTKPIQYYSFTMVKKDKPKIEEAINLDVPNRFHRKGYKKGLEVALASAKSSRDRHGDGQIGFKELIQELEIRIKELK